jgi:release factor glutamine methyltransferase
VIERFREAWRRRVGGQPVQHILGEWDFFGRTFGVDDRALIPRPETEILAAAALAEPASAGRLLDAGTGGGILAITLLGERPTARAVAVDSSIASLALARANARRHGVSSRLRLAASDWVSALGAASFDLAVSNPPYLAEEDSDRLSPTVRDHEPSAALFAGPDGLGGVRALLGALPRVLTRGAPFLWEIGYGQAAAVEAAVRRRPEWRFERTVADHAGIPRVAIARLSQRP